MAHLELVHKAVATAGDHEVVIAIRPQLDGPLQALRGHRGNARKNGRLRFFAPKAAAHATAFHLHVVGVQAQGVGHGVLHLAGVLGGAMQPDAAALLRDGVRDLPFQVKLLLAAQVKAALQAVRGLAERGGHIAPGQAHRRYHVLLGGMGCFWREQGGQGLDAHKVFGAGGSAPGSVAVVRQNSEQGLAQVHHRAIGQDGVVVHDGATVVHAGDVGGGEHVHHAGQGLEARHINVQQPAMRHG